MQRVLLLLLAISYGSLVFAYSYSNPAPSYSKPTSADTTSPAAENYQELALPELPALPDFMALEKEIADILELANMPAMPAPYSTRAILPSQTMTYPQVSQRGRFYNNRFQRIPFPAVGTVGAPAMAYGQPTAEMPVYKEKSAKQPAENVALAARETAPATTSMTEEAASDSAPVAMEVLQVVDSSLGKIYVDSRGFTLYTYTADSENTSTCTGGCAVAWPPYLVQENQVANNEKLAEITRPDGKKQWAYAGQPLYFYAADRAPGETKGEKVANVWFVVKAE
jgi:predicted lipoprotein with Yx(FWY)xxD motif